MPQHRLIRAVGSPALAILVMVGFFMPGLRLRPETVMPVRSERASIGAASTVVADAPLEAQLVTADASLFSSTLPEKHRFRVGCRYAPAATVSTGDATRAPFSTPPRRGPLQDALPSRRLAERAGRLSAPTTAPPTTTV